MDAFDVVCFADETEILNKFKKLNKPIVWSSESHMPIKCQSTKTFTKRLGVIIYLNI